MRNKDKKAPKTNKENYIVSVGAEAVLYGIMFFLLGLIGLLNKGIVGQFITYCVVYLFGAFHVLFFLFLMFMGLYLIIKKRIYRIQIDLKLLGFLLILVSFSIGASNKDTLTFQTFFSEFSINMERITSSPYQISSLNQIPLVGGGLIGYTLAGALNSCITPLGSKIVTIFLLTLGMILVFKDLFIMLMKALINHSKKRKELRKAYIQELEAKKEEEKKAMDIKNKQNNDKSDLDKDIQIDEQFTLTKEEEFNIEKKEEKEEIEDFKNEKIEKEEIKPSTILKNSQDEIKLDNIFFEDKKDDIKPTEKKDEDNAINDDNKSISFFDNKKEESISDLNEKYNRNNKDDKISLFDEETLNKFEAKKEIKPSPTKIFYQEEKKEEKKIKLPYIYPPVSLLSDISDGDKTQLNIAIADNYVAKINEMFQDFKIGAKVVSYTIGPSVTRFDVKTNPGVKLSALAGIQNELAVKLDGNKTVRVELIVEGKDTSAIEVGNKYISTVPFKEVLNDLNKYPHDKLLIPLGKNISGEVVKTSIDQLPHLLIAGTTGSGKSVFVHSLIMSLIMRNAPDDLKLILIDPKKVEFAKYHDLPHLLCPIITDPNEATVCLKRLCDEMDRRYEVFTKFGNGAVKLSEFNEYAETHNLEKMPVIIVVVDEFADFIANNPKEIEASIQRIGQKARACGIYMILATQRPSTQIVTGDIKANIPSRVALSVASNVDSRVILDEVGAETLLGKGDLLARVPISKSLVRAQSAFVPSKDIMAVCDYIRSHGEVNYYEPFLDLKEHEIPSFEGSAISSNRRTDLDPLHEEVKQYVLETGNASSSKIISMFQIGFSRADYILDCLEREGIISKLPNGRRIVLGEGKNGKND